MKNPDANLCDFGFHDTYSYSGKAHLDGVFVTMFKTVYSLSKLLRDVYILLHLECVLHKFLYHICS